MKKFPGPVKISGDLPDLPGLPDLGHFSACMAAADFGKGAAVSAFGLT